MRKFFILWVSLLSFVVSGCSTKHFSLSESKLITLKTPKIKYSDMGYVRYDGDAVQVELFTAGVSIEKITFDNQVCIGRGCMDEVQFSREYVNPHYPFETMRRIIQNSDIFEGKGKSETCGGVVYQYIRNDKIDIVYRRKSGEIYFKDRLNNIVIKIEDPKENNATE